MLFFIVKVYYIIMSDYTRYPNLCALIRIGVVLK